MVSSGIVVPRPRKLTDQTRGFHGKRYRRATGLLRQD
jgi:hypothetical protein